MTALRRWTRYAKLSPRQRYDVYRLGCGIHECCPEPSHDRQLLEVVIRALSPRDRRKLRRRLALLDARFQPWDDF